MRVRFDRAYVKHLGERSAALAYAQIPGSRDFWESRVHLAESRAPLTYAGLAMDLP